MQLCNCVGPLTDRLGAACAARRGIARRLQELHISWGASQLSDEGLAALLHPDVARLHSLVLKGCSQLTDAAWQLIAQHSSSLRCLDVECCGTAAAETKAAGRQHPPMTAAAAAEALSSCHALLALTVRSCTAAWTAAEVEQLRAGCTALQSLCLEA
ncbi:F-box LRR-repeat 2 [Chlorella sorokiniana]|uniref:F-box LRR-repeat 2 n=1 Tax=Chlorella sorokiniana TaxID=3076 RepID=A0A2P6TD75_CHLSO|nr:F-box LRR-repeat 2 [Chlorella sorokiniana]|eukprot:PRW20598.1 F-box LRR-repeat 2 [Chlorella sorokiniana]